MPAVLVLGLCAWLSAPAAAQSTSPVVFDRHMTIGAGATVSQAIGEAIARAEDAFIPVRLFEERGVSRRTANFAYRFLKLTFFDVPQEQLIWVTNHEVFGHGARLRERFDGSIEYEIDAPAPYGDGGGLTRFSFDRAPTIGELLAIDVACAAAGALSQAHRPSTRTAGMAGARLGMRVWTLQTLRQIGRFDDPECPALRHH